MKSLAVAVALLALLCAAGALAVRSPADKKVNKELLHKLVEKVRSGEIKVEKIVETEDELKHMIQRLELKKRMAGPAEKAKLDAEEMGVAAKLAAKLRQKKSSESSESSSSSSSSAVAEESSSSESAAESSSAESSDESASSSESGSGSESGSVSVNTEKGTGFTLRDLEHELTVLADLQRHATGQTLEEIRVEMELVLNRIRRLKGEHAPVPELENEPPRVEDHINHKLDPLIAHLVTLRLSEDGLKGMLPEDVRNLEIHVRALLASIEEFNGESVDAIPQAPESPKCETDPCEPQKKVEVEVVSKKSSCEETNSCAVVAATSCEPADQCHPNTVAPVIVEKNACHDTNSCEAEVKSTPSSCNQCVEALEVCKKSCTVVACVVNKCEDEHKTCHTTCPAETVVASSTKTVRADVVHPTTCVETNSCSSPKIVAALK